MRLINIETLKLETFLGEVPPYAILSHTWGEGEVTLQDLDSDDLEEKPGWDKIVGFCQTVMEHLSDPPRYAWVDTCCIDKTSSAELSESINAMFRWYKESQCCFAYLQDVTSENLGRLEQSRWFTRGWTLQELLAPVTVDFFDQDWEFIGNKVDLGERISRRTNIDVEALRTGDMSEASVSQKMSWASSRQTTRPEDIAYCLLGIFDISMTMLYGEGEKAFIRLQEEILKEYDDHTIFAWDSSSVPESASTIGTLAPHPSYFSKSSHFQPHPSSGDPVTITNRGIRLGLPIIEQSKNPGQKLGLLSCFSGGGAGSAVGIALLRKSHDLEEYSRTRAPPVELSMRAFNFPPTTVFLTKRNGYSHREDMINKCWLHYWSKIQPLRSYPTGSWQHDPYTENMTMRLPKSDAEEVKASIVFQVVASGACFSLALTVRPRERTGKVGLISVSKEADQADHVFKMLSNEPMGNQANLKLPGLAVYAECRFQSIRGSWMCDITVTTS
ncbi:hypothetical protein NW754_000236 [Fusarium falciforme]|nr:hypothetical protein NW754_000236 [Fusarium falciforme]